MKQVSKSECIEMFDNFLNESHSVTALCGYEYSAAELLSSVDPIAYHQEYLNFLDMIEVEEA